MPIILWAVSRSAWRRTSRLDELVKAPETRPCWRGRTWSEESVSQLGFNRKNMFALSQGNLKAKGQKHDGGYFAFGQNRHNELVVKFNVFLVR